MNQQDQSSTYEQHHQEKTIIVAGASGDLGLRITSHLLQAGATVKALVRPHSNTDALQQMRRQGLQIIVVDYNDPLQIAKACEGGRCLISALNGLEDVIVDVQKRLLHAAIDAGVPRFFPSDFSIDYTTLPAGTNRNLDLRRQFAGHINHSPIAATSIFNGMFADLLAGQAPFVLFGIKRVLCWGNPSQLMDFTTIENTAEYTALAALDDTTPRYLRVAGDVLDAQGLKQAASEATGTTFKLLRPGGLGLFNGMIKLTRTLFPAKNEIFPPWQGMQYMNNMFSGLAKMEQLDNSRYPIAWTKVKEVLKSHK